jgi:hypothetical protein
VPTLAQAFAVSVSLSRLLPIKTQGNSLARNRFLFGSPDEVAEQIIGYNKRFGINRMIVAVHWSGMPHSQVEIMDPAPDGVSGDARLRSNCGPTPAVSKTVPYDPPGLREAERPARPEGKKATQIRAHQCRTYRKSSAH